MYKCVFVQIIYSHLINNRLHHTTIIIMVIIQYLRSKFNSDYIIKWLIVSKGSQLICW